MNKEKNKSLFLKEYQRLDANFNTHKDSSYKYLVNFSQTFNEPIHRWYYYQEGYSPQLVINILNYLKIENNFIILDPFAGSGTTLLVAKQFGLKSFGFEINPFSSLMIKVKTRDYTSNELKQVQSFKPVLKAVSNIYDKYELRIIKNLFEKEKLEKIESIKQEINKIRSEKVRDILFAALLSILEDVSNYRKGGNGLKKKRVIRDLDPLREFLKKVNQIYIDLKKVKFGPEPIILNDSCLNILNYPDIKNINISIFSPPYPNCFDPFEVYKIELWIGEFVSSYAELREKRSNAFASNLNVNLKRTITRVHRTDLLDKILEYLSECKLWDKRIPKMLDMYFYEMYTILNYLFQRTKKGGYCVIVVGNSAYGNLAIPTDIILAQIGAKSGFKVKEIIVARENETSSQQYLKLGNFIKFIRESIVIFER